MSQAEKSLQFKPKRKNVVKVVLNKFGLPEKIFIREKIPKEKDVRVDLSFNNPDAVI